MKATDQAWERWGRKDPYFAVVSHSQFRNAAEDGPARDAFFSSGEAYVAELFSLLRETVGLEQAPKRALDFGCGTGRLLIPLAKRSGSAVGLDVSPAMLKEAERNCREHGVSNASLLLSDDRLSTLHGDFDFVHSFIVFQHIPTARGETLLEAILSRLREEGVGALHFTFQPDKPLRARALRALRRRLPFANNVANVLRHRPWSQPPMEMNEYNVNRLLAQFQQHGCHQLSMRFSNHGGHRGALFLFRKRRLPAI